MKEHPSHEPGQSPKPLKSSSADLSPEASLYKKIKESEERFQAAIAAVEGILWTNNAHGEMEGEQPAWAALTGQRFEEYQGYGWSKVVHPDDAQPTVDAWQKSVNTQTTFIFEHRIKVKDGSWRLFSIRAIPLKNDDGTIREWVGVHTDITEKRKAEIILKESEEKFRTMADFSDILIGVNNETVDAVYFNKAWEKLTGKPEAELLSLGWAELLHPDDKQPFLDKFFTAFHNKESYEGEFRMLNKEGGYSWIYARVQVRLHADGSYAGHISSCLDITERKKNEQAVQQSEVNLRNMVLAAPVGMCVMDAKTLVSEIVNDSFVEIAGKPYEAIIGHYYWDTFSEAKAYYEAALQQVADSGEPFYANEVQLMLIRHGREESVYVTFVYMPIKNSEGAVHKIVVWVLDNTAQVLARQRIQESENRFRNMIEQAPVAMLLSRGEDMVIETLNSSMLPFINKTSAAEVTGRKLVEALPELKGQPVVDIVLDVLRTGNPFRGDEQPVDLSYNDRLERRYFNLSYDRINDGSETAAVLHMATDVTEQVLARRKIEESEAKYRDLFETMDQGVCIIEMIFDDAGKPVDYVFVEVNSLFYKQSDLRNVTGKRMRELLPGLEQHWFDIYGKVATTGEPVRFTQGTSAVDKVFDVNAFRVGGDESRRVAVLFTDITQQHLAEKKIQESEKYFHELTNKVPSIIWITEADGSCSFLNKTWYDYTGQTESEGEGFGWLTATHPEDAGGAGKAFVEANTEKKPFIYLYRLRVKDGSYRWAKDIGIPRYDADGNYEGMIGTVVDVHEETVASGKIKESEKQFRLLADTMPQLVWTSDAVGNCLYNNQAMYDYADLAPEILERDGWLDIVHPEDWEENIAAWRKSLETGNDFIFEHRLRRKDGQYRWQLSRAVPQKDADGNITTWVGSSTDIQKIKEEEKRKGDFIKIVSHELKTPITSMKGYVQILLTMLQNNPEPNLSSIPLQPSLQRIDKQIVRLTNLINEMLDLSRLEESKMLLNKQQFDIQKLVQETVEDIQHTNSSHSITLRAETAANVYGDRDRIQQVLINIINNAIKYSPLNRSIEVSLQQINDEFISVSVKDNGIGIDKADQEKIFERFYRVTGRNEDTYAGFGIGLFIAKQIIERHHGQITVESAAGDGSTFTFTLPVAPRE